MIEKIMAKILVKVLEKSVIKALEGQGKEPTDENIEAFIDSVLEEIEKDNSEK